MVEPLPEDDRQGIQSVETAIVVLRSIERGLVPMSLTQIATTCGMGVSKVHRYLVSLGRGGLVSRSPSSGLYDLGPTTRSLGVESLRRMDEVGLVSEAMPGLRDRTGHSVNLAVWGDHGPVVVRWQHGSHALPITVRVGATLPLMGSSIGRVYLAHLPESLTAPVLADEDVPAPDHLGDDEARVRREVLRDGFALTSGTVVPGVTSVAAAVFSAVESLPLVISIAMPTRQVDAGVLAQVTKDLLEVVRTLSADLGHVDG